MLVNWIISEIINCMVKYVRIKINEMKKLVFGMWKCLRLGWCVVFCVLWCELVIFVLKNWKLDRKF